MTEVLLARRIDDIDESGADDCSVLMFCRLSADCFLFDAKFGHGSPIYANIV